MTLWPSPCAGRANTTSRTLCAASADARSLGLKEEPLGHRCSACNGSGLLTLDVSFLPAVHVPCEVCRGSGCLPGAWEVRLRGLALPELLARTMDEAWEVWHDEETVARTLGGAREVGLGYLALRQPGYALSGGEAQRLKIAAELCRRAPTETLYILDEPTVGQHLEDVARLVALWQSREPRTPFQSYARRVKRY
jgi:excinuclease ABC subunit A